MVMVLALVLIDEACTRLVLELILILLVLLLMDDA